MIKFVIMDTDIKYIKLYTSIINQQIEDKKIEYKIETYSKYDKNLRETILDTETYKVFIMEIELSTSNTGIDYAKDIRQRDLKSDIIFATKHGCMFESVFRQVPKVFTFIEKFNHLESRLSDAIKSIINSDIDTSSFVYKNRKTDINILYKDIFYLAVDKNERKLAIVTQNNTYYVNLTLKKALDLCDKRFVQVHKACIVNKTKVKDYNWGEGKILFKNGVCVNLCSKKYACNCKQNCVKTSNNV